MSTNVYETLREFLDQFPLGFPKTESKTEIEILKHLFTEEEAALTVSLKPFPEETSIIADRLSQDESVISKKLETMSLKGLIFRIRRNDKTFYNAIPFMIGIYEYSVNRVDKELAALYSKYYDEAYQREMGASDIPGFRVFPIGETISGDKSLIPYEVIEDEIRSTRVISVAPCVCRVEAHQLGHGCNHSIETCLSFGVAAEYYIENGIGRKIDVEEALAILKKTDEEGLVHAGVNARHLSNICNCCPCCCDSMKGIVDKGHDKHKYMNALFIACIDSDLCTACGNCEERCPVNAISDDELPQVEENQCLGCGLCASDCPSEAISIQLRPVRDEPYDRAADLFKAIWEGKMKNKSSA